MRISTLIISLTIASIAITGCKKKRPELGSPPSMTDAEFTYTPSSATPNIIEFTASKSGAIAVWDFGNGTSAKGESATGTYPLKGTYDVKLTVFTRGGSASTIQKITIKEDDLSLLNSPDIINLTGGVDGKGFKTWVIDSSRAGHFGVGPNPSSALGNIPEWYAAEPFQQAAMNFYNDRYTFHLEEFKFDLETQGGVFVDNLATGEFSQVVGTSGEDFIAILDDQLNENWNIINEEGIKYLTVTGKAQIGFYAGTRQYQILKLSENELSLRYVDANASNPQLAWYLRLVPLGFKGEEDTTGGGEPGPTLPKYSLPITFETDTVDFEEIEDQTDTIVKNPDSSAVNPSSLVLQTEKGPIDWSGLYIDLTEKLDFSTKKTITLKLWAPDGADFLVKIEDSKSGGSVFVEKFVPVTKTNEWIEIVADFTGTAANYDRLVLIPAWQKPNAGTFYIDDIEHK